MIVNIRFLERTQSRMAEDTDERIATVIEAVLRIE